MLFYFYPFPGRTPSAVSRVRTPIYPNHLSTRRVYPQKPTLAIIGISYSEDTCTLEDSASCHVMPIMKSHPHQLVKSDSGAVTSDSCKHEVVASSSSNGGTSQGAFVEENVSDLLSPEAQELASQILLSETDTSQNSLSQEDEMAQSDNINGDRISHANTFLTISAAGASRSDLPVSNVCVAKTQHPLQVLRAGVIEDPITLTSTSSNIVVDLSYLTTGLEDTT